RGSQAAHELFDIHRRTDVDAVETDIRMARFELRDPAAVHRNHPHAARRVVLQEGPSESGGRARDENAVNAHPAPWNVARPFFPSRSSPSRPACSTPFHG